MIQHLRPIMCNGSVTALTVSDDGTLIAVAGEERVELIAADSGDAVHRIPTDSAAAGVALATDKRRIAVAANAPTVTVYDVGTGKVGHQFLRRTVPDFLRNQPQTRVAFFPDQPKLITQADNSDVTVWDCETGAWDYLYRMPHREGVVAMTPTGARIAILSEPNPDAYSGQVTVYRVHQGLQFVWNDEHKSDLRVSCGAFSPGGDRLATCVTDEGIRIWDVESGRLCDHLTGLNDSLSGISFIGDARHLLTVGAQSLEVRRIEDNSAIASMPIPNKIHGSSTSTDGKLLVTFGEGSTLDVWKIDAAP